MKLLLDQNLSPQLRKEFSIAFPGTVHVREVDLASATDDDVWSFAAAGGITIVSKDIDFQQRALLHGPPPKVIWIQLGNCSTTAVATLLHAHQRDIERFIDDEAASFLSLGGEASL